MLVDLTQHSRHTASLAAGMAAAVGAKLTLVHITAGVEVFGPGGSHVDTAWQETIVGFAASEIAKLQQDVGTSAEVIIESGNVPELLNRAADHTNADVLVIGHSSVYAPSGGERQRLWDHPRIAHSGSECLRTNHWYVRPRLFRVSLSASIQS